MFFQTFAVDDLDASMHRHHTVIIANFKLRNAILLFGYRFFIRWSLLKVLYGVQVDKKGPTLHTGTKFVTK